MPCRYDAGFLERRQEFCQIFIRRWKRKQKYKGITKGKTEILLKWFIIQLEHA